MSKVQTPTRPRRWAHVRARSWSLTVEIDRRAASAGEAYPRRHPRDVDAAHALGAQRDEALARGGRVGDELVDLHAVTSRRERPQPIDAFFEERGRAVEVAVAPVMKANTHLQDSVVQPADGCARVTPQELERLVLFEELAGIELRDASDQLRRSGLIAPRARGLFDRPAGDALRPDRKSTRLNSSHRTISYAVFCLKKKKA